MRIIKPLVSFFRPQTVGAILARQCEQAERQLVGVIADRELADANEKLLRARIRRLQNQIQKGSL